MSAHTSNAQSYTHMPIHMHVHMSTRMCTHMSVHRWRMFSATAFVQSGRLQEHMPIHVPMHEHMSWLHTRLYTCPHACLRTCPSLTTTIHATPNGLEHKPKARVCGCVFGIGNFGCRKIRVWGFARHGGRHAARDIPSIPSEHAERTSKNRSSKLKIDRRS